MWSPCLHDLVVHASIEQERRRHHHHHHSSPITCNYWSLLSYWCGKLHERDKQWVFSQRTSPSPSVVWPNFSMFVGVIDKKILHVFVFVFFFGHSFLFSADARIGHIVVVHHRRRHRHRHHCERAALKQCLLSLFVSLPGWYIKKASLKTSSKCDIDRFTAKKQNESISESN